MLMVDTNFDTIFLIFMLSYNDLHILGVKERLEI